MVIPSATNSVPLRWLKPGDLKQKKKGTWECSTHEGSVCPFGAIQPGHMHMSARRWAAWTSRTWSLEQGLYMEVLTNAIMNKIEAEEMFLHHDLCNQTQEQNLGSQPTKHLSMPTHHPHWIATSTATRHGGTRRGKRLLRATAAHTHSPHSAAQVSRVHCVHTTGPSGMSHRTGC